jgi:hypothetical protein
MRRRFRLLARALKAERRLSLIRRQSRQSANGPKTAILLNCPLAAPADADPPSRKQADTFPQSCGVIGTLFVAAIDGSAWGCWGLSDISGTSALRPHPAIQI